MVSLMKKYFLIIREYIANYWAWWRSAPKAAALAHVQFIAGGTAVAIAGTIAMYYHGIPHVRYVGETLDGSETYWSEPSDFADASYLSFSGSMDVVANEYSEGCGLIIWVPIDHVEGLDQKLPFSIIRKAEDWFRTKPSANTRQRL